MDTTGEGTDSRTAMDEPAGSAHSQLPWRVEYQSHIERVSVMSADGYYVTTPCFAPGDEDCVHERANAEFIVKAVNHHAELVEALEVAERAFRVPAGTRPDDEIAALGAMRAVLAKVERHD